MIKKRASLFGLFLRVCVLQRERATNAEANFFFPLFSPLSFRPGDHQMEAKTMAGSECDDPFFPHAREGSRYISPLHENWSLGPDQHLLLPTAADLTSTFFF